VDGIGFDVLGELRADGARGGLLRVGGAHGLAVLGHRVVAFQDLCHHGPGGHESDQAPIERAFLVDRVEGLGLRLGKHQALLRNDAQAGGFQAGVDLAGQVPPRGVGLDDGQRALDRHGRLLVVAGVVAGGHRFAGG
jgi:hypothetical protein